LVTLTATVAPPGKSLTPTGTVTFYDGTTVLGTATLGPTSGASSGGPAAGSLAVSTLAVGTHALTAVYGGDANYVTSTSAAVSQTISAPTDTTTLTVSPNPGTAGHTVTLRATVAPPGKSLTPTGTVTFYDGATVLGTTTLGPTSGSSSGGPAAGSLAVSTLAVGVHSLTAVYGGDVNYTTSTSAAVTETINLNADTTTLTASPNPATVNHTVTVRATVSGGSKNVTPTGTVTFYDGATVLGTATLGPTSGASSGGPAAGSLAVSTLAAGPHALTAVYGGDANYATSTSAALTETINLSADTTTLTASPNPALAGQLVTLKATVAPPGKSLTPTGTVTFYDGTTVLGTATLGPTSGASSGGPAAGSLAVSTLAAGTHALTAVYGGDANYVTSTSALVGQTIQ
jgi:hypothetical protein